MKNFSAFLLAVLLALSLAGCSAPVDLATPTDLTLSSAAPKTGVLTLDKVAELSQKGDSLQCSDLDEYPCEDIGFGIRIYLYEIDESFELQVGTANPAASPMYVRLISKKDGEYIDIREESVEEFVSAKS